MNWCRLSPPMVAARTGAIWLWNVIWGGRASWHGDIGATLIAVQKNWVGAHRWASAHMPDDLCVGQRIALPAKFFEVAPRCALWHLRHPSPRFINIVALAHRFSPASGSRPRVEARRASGETDSRLVMTADDGRWSADRRPLADQRRLIDDDRPTSDDC